MRPMPFGPLAIASMIGVALVTPAIAQTPTGPWVEMESTSINVGLGGQSGDGMLHLPNLGTNCFYPF